MVQQIASPLEVYTKTANRFVFSFIGLSNFTDMEVTRERHGAGRRGRPFPSGCVPEAAIVRAGKGTMASRPNEIEFADEGGVPGTVERRTFLGEIIDYQIRVGGQEVRVQKGRYDRGPQTGEVCRLHFLKPYWFPLDAAE